VRLPFAGAGAKFACPRLWGEGEDLWGRRHRGDCRRPIFFSVGELNRRIQGLRTDRGHLDESQRCRSEPGSAQGTPSTAWSSRRRLLPSATTCSSPLRPPIPCTRPPSVSPNSISRRCTLPSVTTRTAGLPPVNSVLSGRGSAGPYRRRAGRAADGPSRGRWTDRPKEPTVEWSHTSPWSLSRHVGQRLARAGW